MLLRFANTYKIKFIDPIPIPFQLTHKKAEIYLKKYSNGPEKSMFIL